MGAIDKLRILEKIDLEQVSGHYEFCYYPDNKDLGISWDGRVLNIKTGKILRGTIHKDNKVYIHISLGNGKTKAYLLHRLLARTFIGRPLRHLDKSYDELEVNHIDGNRLNNLLSNLEWCTGQENIEHAHINNLHPSDKPIIAKNVLTKEEKIFNSSQACADYFQIHKATFHKHLISGRSGLYHKDNFIFKYNDNSDWNIYPINELIEFCSKFNTKVIVKNKFNNLISTFNSIKEAAIKTYTPHTTLWRKLKDFGCYKTNEYSFKIAD